MMFKYVKRTLSLLLCIIFIMLSFSFSIYFSNTVLVIADGEDATEEESSIENDDKLNIRFFPLGDKTTNSMVNTYVPGDCCIITLGDVQILVDCGATQGSRLLINEQIKKIIPKNDLVWDYVIITHRDSDHHAAFFTSSGQTHDTGESKFVFNYITTENVPKNEERKIGTLIDFDVTTYKDFSNDKLKTMWQNDYNSKCDTYINNRESNRENGKIENYFSGLECSKKNITFDLGAGASLKILYNYYYDHLFDSKAQSLTSADVNNQSVCFLLQYGDHKFLFTGDLEEFDSAANYKEVYGETKLVQQNSILEDGVTFFKAGHHGSKTSNSAGFIDVIKPQYVVMTACAGGNYDFPSQDALDNVIKYTDKVYIPSKSVEKKTEKYYGDIIIKSDGETIDVKTSGETLKDSVVNGFGKPKPITTTEWLLKNRSTSIHTFVFDVDTTDYAIGHCTLIKYGSIDVLIDSGIYSPTGNIRHTNSMSYVQKIKEYCIDGILDYVIVTHANVESISHFIGTYDSNGNKGDGVFGQFEINMLFDFGDNTNISATEKDTPRGWLKRYREIRNLNKNKGRIKDYYDCSELKGNCLQVNIIENSFLLTLFNIGLKHRNYEANYSICPLINYYGSKILYTGDITDTDGTDESLLSDAGKKIKDVTLLIDGGMTTYAVGEDKIKTIHPHYTIINTPLTSNSYYKGYINAAVSNSNKRLIFPMSEIKGGKKTPICGSIYTSFERRPNQETIFNYPKGDNATIVLEKTSWYKERVKNKG